MTDVATFGISTGIGAGIRVGEKGIVLATEKLAPKILKSEKAISKTIKIVPGVYKGGTTIAGSTLGLVYAGKTAQQIYDTPSYEEKGEVLGKSIKELALFGAGYSKGKKLASKGIQILKTRGMPLTEPPVRQSVLKGEESFPTAGKRLSQIERAKLHKKILEEGKFTEPFKDLELKKPSPGIHIAPRKLISKEVTRPLHISSEASVHFLGLENEKALKNYANLKKMFEPTPEPIGYVITPKRYKILLGNEIKRGEYIWKGKTEPGIAYIPGNKPEIQAVFEKGTKLKRAGKGKYFEYKGYRIPVPKYEAVGKDVLKEPKKTIDYDKLIKKTTSEIPSYPKVSFVASPLLIKPYSSSIKSKVSLTEPSYILKSPMYKPNISKPSYYSTKSSSVSSISSIKPSSSIFPKSSIKPSYYSTKSSSKIGYPRSYFPSELIKKPVSYLKKSKVSKKQPTKQAPSYDVYIKPPKKKVYVKVTKKPVGLTEARDTRNYFIDETTSRQGFLKPRQNKPSKLMFDVPRGYAKNTAKKFRTFKQEKGVRTKLPKERKIEYSKYALDTKGEKKQIDIFKLLAQREKKKRKLNRPIGLTFN